MSKPVVVFSQIFYPISIGRYFQHSLERRDDIELYTVGPYTGTWIPWSGGMNLPEKYDNKPDIPLDKNVPRGMPVRDNFIKKQLGVDRIDAWIMCDAGFHFSTPPAEKRVLIQTDPHVLDYSKQKQIYEYSFCMQKVYMKSGDIYLPYAVDPHVHYPMDLEKEFDVSLVGLQYSNRTQFMNLLKSEGVKIHYSIGKGFDEYREIYNKTKVAISWSSKKDLIARVFEAMAMKIPLVTNYVPDLPLHFTEGSHFLGFENVYEGVEKVQRILREPEKYEQMVEQAYEEVINKHTYDHRIEQIFEEIGL